MKPSVSKITHKHLRRCFISAPFGCDLSPLVDILTSVGIRPRRLDSIRGNQSLIKALLKELSRSDFVCAVFVNGFETASILFEVGLALGQNKPVMILAEPGVTLPIETADLTVGRFSLGNPETIKVAVTSHLKGLELLFKTPVAAHDSDVIRRIPPPPSGHIERVLEKRILPQLNESGALGALDKIKKLPQPLKGRQFEEYVASLFEKAGITAAIESRQADRGVDIAIWLDEVSRVFTGVVLAELKICLTPETWRKATSQLVHYMAMSRAQCGLLITLEPMPDEVPRFTTSLPMVLTLTADELVRLLANKSLAKELIKARNQAVHG